MKTQNKTTWRSLFIGSLVLTTFTLRGALTSFTIQDIGTFAPYNVANVGQTYAGTGFVGMYSTSFAHLFGLEHASYSRTALEVDISGLAGSVINSAYLTFTLLNGAGASQTVTATSFTANGNLGHFWNAPNNLGSTSATVNGLSANSIDVTSLLQSRVSANDTWFGLHLAGSSQYQWTYTAPTYGYNPDSAQVRLVVDYSPVPEPSTYVAGVLLLLPFAVTTIRRLRQVKTA